MSKLSNALRLSRMRGVLRRINALAPVMERKSDAELKGMTRQLRRRLQKGASEESILVEAYAAIREACRRVLRIYPYDAQILGAIALYEGAIAQALGTGDLCVLLQNGKPVLLLEGAAQPLEPLWERLRPVMADRPRGQQLCGIYFYGKPLPRTASGKIMRWAVQREGILI